MELDNFDFPLEVKKKSLLPIHELYRLKAGVQDEGTRLFTVERRQAFLTGIDFEGVAPCRRGTVLARDSSASPSLIMDLNLGKIQGPDLRKPILLRLSGDLATGCLKTREFPACDF